MKRSGSVGSQTLSLDGAMPPSRKDGWENFQNWTKRWNRFFATLFCVLAFALLFAIVVVNVINAERESDPTRGGGTFEETTGPQKPKVLTTESFTEELPTESYVSSDSSSRFKPEESYNDNNPPSFRSRNLEPPAEEIPETGCIVLSHCSILCKSMTSSEVSATINRLFESILCSRYSVRLEDIRFIDEVMPQNWVTFPRGLSSLEIVRSNLREIEEDVFNDRQYFEVTALRLCELQITQLGTNIFRGLSFLEYLELKQLPLERIAQNVMNPLKQSLQTFLFLQNLNPIDPCNFTGSVNLISLKSLSMQHNDFGDTINKKTFKNMPKLIDLTLNDNKITSLTSDAFQSIGSQLRVVRLDGNLLQSLPKDIFSRIKSSQFRIFLERNPWDCDCNLVELQQHLQIRPEWFNDDPVCVTPKDLEGQLIRDARFCATTESPTIEETTTIINCHLSTTETNTTTEEEFNSSTIVTEREEVSSTGSGRTTITITTSTDNNTETTSDLPTTTPIDTSDFTTTSTPTHRPPSTTPRYTPTTEVAQNCSTINKETICDGDRYWSTLCQLPAANLISASVNSQYYGSPMTKVKVETPSFKVRIKEVERFMVEIHVKRRYSSSENYFILWFADENTDSGLISNDKLLADCQCSQQEDVYVQQLQPNTLYVFCVIVQHVRRQYESDGYVKSPFDCLPYKTMPLKSEEAWLTYSDKWIVTSMTLLILVCCGAFGALTMYLTIRRNPTLLRGSQRVVIVNNNQVKVYTSKSLKKTDSTVSSNIASIQSRPLPDIQQSTYLTPIPRKMSIYKKVQPAPGSRRASDSSIESLKTYITTSSAHKLHTNKSPCYCAVADKKCFYDLKDVPQTPPPLPHRLSVTSEYIKVVKSPDCNIYSEFSYASTGREENIYSKTELDCCAETL